MTIVNHNKEKGWGKSITTKFCVMLVYNLTSHVFCLKYEKPSSDEIKIPNKCYYVNDFNPYPTAFPYGNGMVLHFYQQQESSTTKTVHKVINRGLKAYVYEALNALHPFLICRTMAQESGLNST